MRSHRPIWALSVLTAGNTHTNTELSEPKASISISFYRKIISHQTYETFGFLPILIKETKCKEPVSPDAAGVCVLQLCCVWRYGPQSNGSVLWAGGQQTLFCIPAAAAHLQTQQPIRNKSRHSGQIHSKNSSFYPSIYITNIIKILVFWSI